MHALPLLRAFSENNAWSNARLHAACAALSEADYLATRTSFFPSIHATLVHILLVDRYYLDALEGGGLGNRVYDDEASLDTFAKVQAGQRAADARLVDFVRELKSDAALDAIVTLVRTASQSDERVIDVLSHLFVHQIHHRGQVHAMLSGTKVAPPQLDEFFLREDAPRRLGELRAIGLPVR